MQANAGKGKPARKRWSLLIYIAGDNNLSENGLQDVNELCAVGASEDVHIGLEIDMRGEFTGSIRYEISPPDWTGKAHRTVIERLPEKDTGAPETLRSFAEWGLRRYPADNTLMVVWGHGSGFRARRRDVGFDDFGSSLDMPEVHDALARAGVGPGKRIAILGFDACLMSMIEIAHHLRDQAEIIVGSQQTEPGEGWPYDQVLLSAKKADGRADLARRIVKVYIENYRKRGVFDVTQSAIETSKTEAAIRDLSDVGFLLAREFGDLRESLRRMRVGLQTFEMADYVDLVHLSEALAARIDSGAIRTAAKALSRDAAACILASGKRGNMVRNAHGSSVWFPATADIYNRYRPKYRSLEFAGRHGGWIAFLDAYHA